MEEKARGRRAHRQAGKPGGRSWLLRLLRDAPWLLPFTAIALAGLVTFDFRLHINGDNVAYMRLAENIRGGDPWPASRFPPGFPWLLVPVQWLWGLSLPPQKLTVFVMYLIAAFFASRLAIEHFGRFRGSVAAFLGLTIVPVIEYSHYVMSEVPYLAMCLAALWFVEGRATRGVEARYGVLAGLLAGAAFWIRSIGLAALATVVLVPLLQGRRRATIVCLAVCFVALSPWLLRTLIVGGAGESYVRQFLLVNPYHPEFGRMGPSDLWQRVAHNAGEYFLQEIPHDLVPLTYRSTYRIPTGAAARLPFPVAAGVLGLAVVGLAQALRRGFSWAWLSLLTLALCILWPPVWTSTRFLVPILPFLIWGMLLGLEVLRRWLLRDRARVLWGLAAAALVVASLAHLARLVSESRRYPQPWRNYFELAHWVRDNTPDDVLIIDRKPGLFGFVAGRRCESFPREPDKDDLLANLRDRGADLVVVSRIPYDDIGRYLVPAVADHPESFEVLHRLLDPPEAEAYVLRFVKAGSEGR